MMLLKKLVMIQQRSNFDAISPDAKDEDSLGLSSTEEDTLDKDTGLKVCAYCH